MPETMGVPGGCEICDHTGYRGRVGIYELLRCDETIRTMIRNEGRIDDIRNVAIKNGMRLIHEDAMEKLNAGLTTLDEILRVIPLEAARRPACASCNEDLLPDFRFCPYCGVPCNLDAEVATRRAPTPEDLERMFRPDQPEF